MTPSVLRNRGTALGLMVLMLYPLTMTLPSLGRISLVKSLMMVDLPDPEGPTKKTNSPSSMRSVTPLRAFVPLS
jgi:hypothetical protein